VVSNGRTWVKVDSPEPTIFNLADLGFGAILVAIVITVRRQMVVCVDVRVVIRVPTGVLDGVHTPVTCGLLRGAAFASTFTSASASSLRKVWVGQIGLGVSVRPPIDTPPEEHTGCVAVGAASIYVIASAARHLSPNSAGEQDD
jgi:hypothetical protein